MTSMPTKKRPLVEEDDPEQVQDQAVALPTAKAAPRRKKNQPRRGGCLSGSSMVGLPGDALVRLARQLDIDIGLGEPDLRRLARQAMASLGGDDTTALGPGVRLPTSVVLVFRSKTPIQKGEKLTTDNVEPILILKAASNPDMVRRVHQGAAARDKIAAHEILWRYMIK